VPWKLLRGLQRECDQKNLIYCSSSHIKGLVFLLVSINSRGALLSAVLPPPSNKRTHTHTTSSVRLWLLLRNVFGRLRAAMQKNATAKSGALRYSGGCCFSYIFDAKQRVKRALAVSLFSLARTHGGVGGARKDVRDWRSCLAGKL
jgi:hypothetical protein